MIEDTVLFWDEAFLAYDFGPAHPLAPRRLDLTIRLARELGVLDQIRILPPQQASYDVLGLVHDDDYIEAVRRASKQPDRPEIERGLGTPDNPTFADMHEASALVAGASAQAAEAVWTRRATHAVNIAGGLHHAMPDRAAGFCVYNDAAIAIARLLGLGAERIAYVDIDVHHGDGVQAVFWNDPRVLTISLHESGRYLFPGTGFPEEAGGPDAEGSAVNVALPPGTGDAAWLRAFHAVVPLLLDAFEPQVLVTQHGCDSHFLDPLAHLTLSVDAQRAAAQALHRLAHDAANGRWIVLGGGGYAIVDVVPRTWTHLMAEAVGAPIEPSTPIPEGWRGYVTQALGEVPPAQMTDGREPSWADFGRGYDPGDWVDRAILATRRAVFPAHGIHIS